MSIPSIEKVPGESRFFYMQCAARLAEDETISGVTSIAITPTTASPLTYPGGAIASGTVIQFRLTGGLTGTKYKIVITYTTSLSNTRVGTGYIQVENEGE